MMSPLNSLIIKLKTGSLARKKSVLIPKTALTLSIVSSLYNFGYIQSYLLSDKNNYTIEVFLRYTETGPLIKSIKRVSLPSKRVYCSVKDLKENFHIKRLPFLLVSTSSGVLSRDEAIYKNVGGEPMFFITL